MTTQERLQAASRETTVTPREEHLRVTIAAARASFLASESARPLSRTAFLAAQLRLIHKRVWLAQALLLALVWWILPDLATTHMAPRTLGIAAALFVVLLIPELARNTSAGALEIEGTTHYTLRHIYAARMLLCGGIDLVILTCFCGAASFSLAISLATLVTQFLLPLVVTSCLCFGILASPRHGAALSAICAYLFWSGIWWLVVTSDVFYNHIATPIWLATFGLCLLMLVVLVRRWLNKSTTQWEGTHHGTLYE